MARTALLDIPELLSPDAQRLAAIEKYGSVIEPVEPTLTDRIRNFVYDATMRFGGDRGDALRRAGMAEDVIGVTPLQGFSDYQLAKRAYSEGDKTSGDINMAMAATSLLPGNERPVVSKLRDIFSTTDKNAIGMTPKMLEPQTASVLQNRPDYFRTEKDLDYQIVNMSPDDYLSRAGEILSRRGNATAEEIIAQRADNPDYIQKMAESMLSGNVYAAPYLDYKGQGQEGFHRALAAKQLGVDEIPVMVFDSYSNPSAPAGLSALNDLDMSYDARMRRADEMGMTTQGYSGSTHDISRFRGDIANPQGDWGRATYASTSIDDVNANYAGVGPDLTSRIEVRAEQIKDDASFNDDDLKSAFESQSGKPWDNMNYDEKLDIARGLAEKELVGDAQGGIVYPLRINTEKYAVIGGPNSTVLKFDKSALKGLDPDSDEYYEAITEASDDLYQSVYDALSSTDAYIEDGDIMKVMSEVSDSLAGGDLDLTYLDSAIRRHIIDAYDDDTGGMVSPGGISAQVLKNLGYEGVIDNTVNTKFGTGRSYGQSMAGVNPDTQHIITFPDYESRIRSTYAAFDPSKKSSSDILAGITGGSLIGGSALSGQRQENNK